jgi:hypothetical protein
MISFPNPTSTVTLQTMRSEYQEKAVIMLMRLKKLKADKKKIEAEISEAEHCLAIHMLAGDLDDLRSESNENTVIHNGVSYIYSAGRLNWDFSSCPDILKLEATLKEKKEAAKSVGKAGRTIGKPFWSVKA